MTGSLTHVTEKGLAGGSDATLPVLDWSYDTLQDDAPLDNRQARTGCDMAQMRSRVPLTVYEVLDDGGHAIGQVSQPAGEPVVGWGEGTVLLRRDDPHPVADA